MNRKQIMTPHIEDDYSATNLFWTLKSQSPHSSRHTSFLLLCIPDILTHFPSSAFRNGIHESYLKHTQRTHEQNTYTLLPVLACTCACGCMCGPWSGRPCQCLCSNTRFFKSQGLERVEKKSMWIIGLLLMEWRRNWTSERKWEWEGRNITSRSHFRSFRGDFCTLPSVLLLIYSRTSLDFYLDLFFSI